MPSGNRAIIEVTGLSKRYGDVISVDDISFDVGRGELFSLYNIRRKWIL